MHRRLKIAIVALFVTTMFSSCYKDPFYNDEGFMVGRWELIRIHAPISWGSIELPPLEIDLPYDFEFQVEKAGYWIEYLQGVRIRRSRVNYNLISLDPSDSEQNRIDVRFFKFNSLKYYENYEGSYTMFFNETKDTLTSINYLPYELYHREGRILIFTFAKSP
ncbi:MAG: hypothetical protein GC193_14545 [Cryomorphaceae bacterium]|nr:hypothetical protein [Cryomorphaceae bacterium]